MEYLGQEAKLSIFRDRAHAAAFFGEFFRQESSRKSPFFEGSGVIIGFTVSNPEMHLVLDASVKPEPGRSYAFSLDDPKAPKPAIEFFMDADTLHALYHGDAQATALIASGKVTVNGDLPTAMRLLPALATRIPSYKAFYAKFSTQLEVK